MGKGKIMKKSICMLLILGLGTGLCGCGGNTPTRYEKLQEFTTAFQNGDAEAQKAFLQEDSPWLPILDAQSSGGSSAKESLYQKVVEAVKDTDIEIKEPAKKSDTQYFASITAKDFDTSIKAAMAEAIAAEVQSGGEEFRGVTSWLENGVTNAQKGESSEAYAVIDIVEKEFVMDTKSNESFLDRITGDFLEYLDTTITSCTGSEDGITDVMYIAAKGDYIIGMIEYMEQEFDVSEYTEEEQQEMLDLYLSDFQDLEGVTSHAEFADGKVVLRVGVDFSTASSYTLQKLGLIDGSMRGTYLSLEETISGFESTGQVCETKRWDE